jgi:hypothetical protein
MTVKYPDIHVRLTGEDGNAFAVLGAVCKAMQEAGVSLEERMKFSDEATRGDYNRLLRTCMEWVDVL